MMTGSKQVKWTSDDDVVMDGGEAAGREAGRPVECKGNAIALTLQ